MKKLFYILIFFSFALFSHAHAADKLNARCESFIEKPNVTVKVVFEQLRYDNTKVSRTLARMHKEIFKGDLIEGYRVNGLTPYQLATELLFTVGKKTFNDGVTCFFPVDVTLLLTLKEPIIYIERNIEPGTCAYNVTLRHEQTHEQINVETLEYYMPIIKDRFLAAVKKYSLASRPKDDIPLETVQKGLEKKYLEAINPILDELNNEINKEQVKLDTKEQYDYEQSLCPE